MRCPRCGHEEDRVIDSRAVRDGKGVRRRRQCEDCGHRFTTYEYVDAVALLIVKRDGRREPYQRDKVREGIRRACQKRPFSISDIDALIDRVEARLHRQAGEEVSTKQLGQFVMEELRQLDPVAYVRFASVYRRFESVNEFIEIVEGIPAAESPAWTAPQTEVVLPDPPPATADENPQD